MKEAIKGYNKLKKAIDNKEDTKELVDLFYFNKKAIEMVKDSLDNFFINSYYNLTIADVLIMVDETNSIEDLKEQLYENFKKDYALAWYSNFIEIMKKIGYKKF